MPGNSRDAQWDGDTEAFDIPICPFQEGFFPTQALSRCETAWLVLGEPEPFEWFKGN